MSSISQLTRPIPVSRLFTSEGADEEDDTATSLPNQVDKWTITVEICRLDWCQIIRYIRFAIVTDEAFVPSSVTSIAAC